MWGKKNLYIYFFISPCTLFAQMLHNVSVVNDGFVFAGNCVSSFPQTQNCGEAKRHKGRKPDWCFA
jgi:hypothetical protein